jgi:hypothetical protein
VEEKTMDRTTVLDWLRGHPYTVHGDLEMLVSSCEHAVRRHARDDAWIAAKRYVAERKHAWEESHGAHASEAFVAQEVCKQLADELARHEPGPRPGDEEHLAGGDMKAALEREAWEFMIPWIMGLARDEEHRTWGEIVGHTKRRARELIHGHHLSSDTRFDHTKCYGDVAARIAGILAEDYAAHLVPPRPGPARS